MNRLITLVCNAAAWLVLPLAVLLFAQWPLRELVQAYSRQANDVAQILFALLAAAAVTAASVAGTHLAASHSDTANPLAHAGGRAARLRSWALCACVAPWALWMLWASGSAVMRSVLGLEKFSETLTPGFFIIKAATLVLYGLVLLQAVAALRSPPVSHNAPNAASTDRAAL